MDTLDLNCDIYPPDFIQFKLLRDFTLQIQITENGRRSQTVNLSKKNMNKLIQWYKEKEIEKFLLEEE